MPRGPRLDAPGALHHVMIRGIERRRIFRTDGDRRLCLDRLATLVTASEAGLYAWCLMPNHVHVLLRTGAMPLSLFMRRWVGPYASSFNRRHRRAGHLFQNRFKSIVVEEEAYLLELVRYIHLNPVRARLCAADELDSYRWTGHAVLLGRQVFPAQNAEFVLSHFGSRVGAARTAYREFVWAGAARPRPDLSGGGLRRSVSGWEHVSIVAGGRERWTHDERILGSSEFVSAVIEQANPPPPPKADVAAVVTLLVRAVAVRCDVTPDEIASSSLRRRALTARAIVCQLAVGHRGMSLRAVARALGISKQSVARAVERGAALDIDPAEFESRTPEPVPPGVTRPTRPNVPISPGSRCD